MTAFLPTDEQERALAQPAPLLVLAGAGTGKTTVLTRRIARLIGSGRARPDQVLALTFAEKAAAEMAERLEQVLGEHGLADGARDVTATTFNAFGMLVVRENLPALGFERPPAVLSTAAAWQLMASLFDDLTFDAVEISTAQPAAVFGHLLQFIGQCQNHLIGPEELEDFLRSLELSTLAPAAAEHLRTRAAELRDVAAAYRRYEQVSREKGSIDFGDQLMLPVRLFAAQPAVRDDYRRRFPFVFVDEYQDTNHAQRMLLLALVDPARPEIMVIGDDDQAIYQWRGAMVQNILRFPDEAIFAPGRVASLPMTLNRRSFPPILDLANRVIAEVGQRHAKQARYHEENERERASVGRYVAATDRHEGEWIARRIQELEPEARGYPGAKRGYGACAVLCRKRSLFQPIGAALEAAGIPFELVGGAGFYGRWEIRDILSYLRVLANPADDLALARILRSRRWRLSGRDIFHLARWARRQGADPGPLSDHRRGPARPHLLDAVLRHQEVEGVAPEAGSRLAALRRELEGYARDARLLSLAELVERVVEGSGYRRELSAQPGFEPRVALLNLAKLAALARQFEEGTERAALDDFVEFVGYAADAAEEAEIRPMDEETDTVKVMTVHQAKGLEFPIVFIPGLARRIFPQQRRDESDRWEPPWELRGDRDYLPTLDLTTVHSERDLKKAREARKEAVRELQLDEERRLFYVAITRAQRHLYLSRAHRYGATKLREPSAFWELVEASGLAEDLGQEDPPAEVPPGGEEARAAKERPTARPAPSRLLLDDEALRVWIEETAHREGYDRWTALRAQVDAHLQSLAPGVTTPAAISGVEMTCSGLVRYLDCPRLYRYLHVDRLPIRPSPAAATGLAVHRRIEELSRASGAASGGLRVEVEPDEEELREVEHERATTEMAEWRPASMDEMVARFRESAYGRRPATYVEYPIYLPLGPGVVRGRVDRIDRTPEGRCDLVDFKSGRRSTRTILAHCRQLALYALAVRELLDMPAERITGHLFFLWDGRDLAYAYDDATLERARQEAEEVLRAVAQGHFPRAVDRGSCEGCDYGHLCVED